MHNTNTILFVDRAIDSAETLISGLQPKDTVHSLSRSGDPLTEIASALTGRRNVARLVILAHGSPGTIELSGKKIDCNSLRNNETALANIKTALAADAELILASCSTGAGAAGDRFVDALESALGVTVSAATADLGGDAGWDALPAAEYLFARDARESYPHRLATFDFENATDNGTTVTQEKDGVTVTVARSDNSGDIAILNVGGAAGNILDTGTGPLDGTVTVTFSTQVNVTGLTLWEPASPTASGGNYVLDPNTTATNEEVAENTLNQSSTDLTPNGWDGITSFTVSYSGGGNYFVGLDNIVFTSAAPANNLPALGGTPTDVTINEASTNQAIDLSAYNISDADGDTITLTLGVDTGTIATTDGNGTTGGVTIATSGTGSMTLQGTAANLNTYLNDTTKIVFTPVSTSTSAVTLTVTPNDGTGNGTADTITINVTDVTAASTNAAGFNTTNGTNLDTGITFGTGDETLTIASASHTTGSTADGGAGTDTLVISQTGTDLTQLTSLSNFETLTLGSNVTVTMSETQHEAFSTINGAAGVEAITLSTVNGDGNVTGSGNIETYNLNGAFTFTIGTAGQSVTGNAGANQTVQSSASLDTLSGTLNGGTGGSDTLVLDTGDNIASATISNFENLTLDSGASVTMTVANHDGFSGTVTAAGNETITFSATGGDTIVTGNSAIETYVLGTGGITFTLGATTQNVTGSSGADTVNAGTLTITGSTLNGNGGTDTLQLGTGANISGSTVSNFENLTIASGGNVTMGASQSAQFSGTITAAGSETVNITGDGSFTTLANIETYSVGDDSTNARTITISGAGTSVTASSGTDAVTFNVGGLTYTGTITGEATTGDTLSLGNNANIAGGTITNVGTLDVVSGASVTMTESQHDGFGTITGTGTNLIALSSANGDGAVTGDADIENYTLNSSGITFTLGAAGQNVTGSSGADTVNAGTLTITGSTLNGNGGTDTLQLGTGANISGSTVSNFENLTIASGGNVTMGASQSAQFSGTITAAGSETVNITGDGSFTTLANIETYSVGDDSTNARTITISGAGTSVTASSGTDAVTFNAGGLTYTGTITGEGTVNDTLQLSTGADISGGTISGVENLTLGSGANVSMSLTQFSGFNGTLTAAGSETLNLSGDGNFSTVSNIESYVLGDSTTDARTITITNAGHSASATSATDAVTFDAGGLTLSGTLTGEGTVNDTLSLGNGANISGATISGIENLTLGSGASVSMTAAQLGGFTGTVTAAGTETITLTATGNASGASLAAIETITTAADASAQTVTLTAIQAAGKTLTAGDAGSDHFVITGSAGNQAITGSAGGDTIDGGAGNDSLYGFTGADFISGGDGADLLVGNSGADTLNGGAGNDTFSGSASDFNGDLISGLAAGDVITINSADLTALNGTTLGSTINLGGPNTLNFSGAASNLKISASLNSGNTTLTFATPVATPPSSGGGSSGPVVVTDNPTDTSTGGARTITNNGSTSGSAAIVQNTGNNGNIVTATLPANTSISSEGPAAAQSSTDALNTLITAIDNRDSTAETDLIGGARTFLTKLSTTTMLDVRTIIPTTTNSSLSEPIVITGTDGGTQSEAFVIDLRSLPSGSTLQLDNIEFASIMGNATVNGGAGQNYVTGDDNSQFISLGAEDDTLYGGGGTDTIGSGYGEDILYGNQGSDLVFGGGGMDTLYGGQDADTVRGDNDNDFVYGNKGNDTLSGGENDDVLFGGQNDDIVYGNTGNDSLNGNLGNDTLFGGQGNDLISGQAGDDRLAGNKGDDTLIGGDGADTFVFQFGGGNDRVEDFQTGTDSLEFQSGLTYTASENAGNTVLTLSDGGTVTLVGVSPSELGLAARAGWEFV